MADCDSDAEAKAPEPEDYEAIESAVMETQRGRWFLAEFSRRNRSADTAVLLAAIDRLENALPREPAAVLPAETGATREAIVEMAEEIAAAKREIATIGKDNGDGTDIADATAELDAVVDATEGAASDILEAAEAVQELAWTLREQGTEEAFCDALDARATEIYTACSFQDITGQRTRKVVRLLQTLDQRISTLASLWKTSVPDSAPTGDDESDLLNGPAREGEGVSQEEIDLMMVDTAESAPVSTQEPPAADASSSAEEHASDSGENSLEVMFDRMSQDDKDSLFA